MSLVQNRPQDPDKTDKRQAENECYTTLLLVLFVGSGCAALIYEVVWFQLLRFAIGATSISLSILLACFMGGLFLGSLLFHRYISIDKHPLRIYAYLEFGIGIFGILIPILLPFVTSLYTSYVEYGYLNIFLRALISLVILLPPTILMGATLPALARWVKMTRTGTSRIGYFYSANIAGSIIGVLIAGFLLLRLYDMTVTTTFAVLLNISIGLLSLRIANRSQYSTGAIIPKVISESAPANPVHIAIALSGVGALGAQIVWMRNLSLLFGATVYTFSVVLTVFLAGLGIGSFLGSWLLKKIQRPVIAFISFQSLLVVCIPYAGLSIIYLIPDLHFLPEYQGWIVKSLDDILRCSVAILPATILWGASFPVALALTLLGQNDPGKAVGKIYAANTAGAIIGAVATSLFVIPTLGTRVAQQVLTWSAVFAVLVILIPMVLDSVNFGINSLVPKLRKKTVIASACVSLFALGYVTSQFIPMPHNGMISYGRDVFRWDSPEEYLYSREGITSSIAVSREKKTGYLNFHISGKVVASNWPADMRNQRILGHLPALLHNLPKSILVIGFGAGVTAGTFSLYPSVERIVIVEIEPDVPVAANRFFGKENYDILKDKRVEIIVDDARHFVTTTQEKFDIITTDPIHPWVKGASALYTTEFFELLKHRLNPGGFITQWVPLYETNEAAVKSEIGTFFEVFPNASLWNTSDSPNFSGYDIVMLGQIDPITIHSEKIQGRLDSSPKIKNSLSEVKYDSAVSVLKTFSGQNSDIATWLEGVELNRDNNLRLEYLAGQSLDDYGKDRIHYALTRDLAYPESLFSVSPSEENKLRHWFTIYSRL